MGEDQGGRQCQRLSGQRERWVDGKEEELPEIPKRSREPLSTRGEPEREGQEEARRPR